ncbi:hypothetical protein [Allostreptomyces psammosilenae]|uniref:Uncharacterized protein n=1 Tax=Allostreptomyces psammosilenae TaxID=1892865 RepID=A0A853A8C9_9ACTN|nr:hypothetical protein [Allostreptomyces psammosilenae]NYI06788.1 hypothetical protein [Allostreptomyces psammosilenae]
MTDPVRGQGDQGATPRVAAVPVPPGIPAVPPAVPPGATPDAGGGEGLGGTDVLPLEPFDRRVRLLVEVVDQADEIALAHRLLESRGWPVRRVVEADQATVGERRAGLLVEVRLRGARRGARAAAVRQVERMAAQAKIGLWVRDSALVEPERELRTTYFVRTRVPPSGPFTRWFTRLWFAAVGSDLERALSLPRPADEAAASAELQARVLAGPAFDPDAHTVRVQIGPSRFAPAGGGPDQWRAWVLRAGSVALAGMAVPLVLGALIQNLPGWWWVPAALPLPPYAWVVGRWLTDDAPRHWAYRLLVGAFVTLAFTTVGYLLFADPPDDLPGRLVLAVLLILGAVGVWLACRHSWFSRNASWVVPVLATPLPFVLPWFGGLLHTVYLEDGFGIPVDTVPVTGFWRSAAALEPVAVATVFPLLFVGAAGWLRYFHQWTVLRELVSVMVPLLCLVYVLTALLLGLEDARAAADRAARAARAGEVPASYFGLRGDLVCVTPMAPTIPVFNGPLPTDRPVLTFGSAADRLWLWDPARAGEGPGSGRPAVSVRLEDVTVTRPANGSGGACPPVPAQTPPAQTPPASASPAATPPAG